MNAQEWNALIARLPSAHVLQTWEWGQVKSRNGWQPVYKIWREAGRVTAGALVHQRAISLGGMWPRLNVMYVPKGPLLCDWADPALRSRVLGDLRDLARQEGAIFIKIDPDVVLGTGVPGDPDAQEAPEGMAVAAELQAAGWRFSPEQVQFRNTVVIDLTASESELLRRMKQKTRYNIRLAERKGVQVRPGTPADYGLMYQMYAETSVRDGFVIREERYYRDLWSTFQTPTQEMMSQSDQNQRAAQAVDPHTRPEMEPLIADVDGEPVAAVVVFRFAGRAWYLYGMSRQIHRDRMPNYLLQWEAIRRSKMAGCTAYDLWGAPDRFVESDPLWGVYRFKEGLGGTVVRHLGAWDLPVRPRLYRLYTQTLPRLLAFMRRRGKTRTEEILR